MLADPTGEVTKALGLELDLTAILGGIRLVLASLLLETLEWSNTMTVALFELGSSFRFVVSIVNEPPPPLQFFSRRSVIVCF
jgi:hypothetical protein